MRLEVQVGSGRKWERGNPWELAHGVQRPVERLPRKLEKISLRPELVQCLAARTALYFTIRVHALYVKP